MTEPIELVIFDCDGVLVDSERISVKIDGEVLAELGWPMSDAEIVNRFMGRTHAFMVSQIEEHLGHPLPAGLDEEFQARYHAAFEAELTPVDGIVEALDAITVATCVASSGAHEKLRHTLGLTGLYERFAGRIFSATEVPHGKPAPDLFLHAADRMGVPAARCAVVEDSGYGVQAARAAGMAAFGYSGGLASVEQLAGPGTVLFDDMRKLPELLAAPE